MIKLSFLPNGKFPKTTEEIYLQAVPSMYCRLGKNIFWGGFGVFFENVPQKRQSYPVCTLIVNVRRKTTKNLEFNSKGDYMQKCFFYIRKWVSFELPQK